MPTKRAQISNEQFTRNEKKVRRATDNFLVRNRWSFRQVEKIVDLLIEYNRLWRDCVDRTVNLILSGNLYISSQCVAYSFSSGSIPWPLS